MAPKRKGKAVPEAPPPAPDEDAPLSALGTAVDDGQVVIDEATGKKKTVKKGPKIKDDGRRQRWEAEEDCPLVRDVVDGFLLDAEEDPEQAGGIKDRQSAEVTELERSHPQAPVAKKNRGMYVWVARAVAGKVDSSARYTLDPENMVPMRNFVNIDDNSCDVCGAKSTEQLYEFRCYTRMQRIAGSLTSARDFLNRRLNPCRAFISKECGKNLLGKQSETSRLMEQLSALVRGDNPEAALRELWVHAPDKTRRLIQEKLALLAKQEAGESALELELRRAEEKFGALERKAEDPFRVIARSLMSTSAWTLAALSLGDAARSGEQLAGFLGQVAESLRQRQPLPMATLLTKNEVVHALQLLVAKVPLEVRLKDMLSDPQIFKPPEDVASQAVIEVVWTTGGCHALADKGTPVDLRDAIGLEVQQAKDEFAQQLLRARASKKEDKEIELPQGAVSAAHVRHVLEKVITWPYCFSRANVKPETSAFIEAFPMGMVLNYAKGLMVSSTLRLWPTLGKLLNRFILQTHADFKYTTIQMNKNYAAKMHVDGNNHGPSFIIALGDFKGGELWIYEEGGDYEMPVPERMKGWPQLVAGTKAKGRLHSIKDRWFRFDGTIPHAVLPYQGTRYSIVYFSRRGYLRVPEAAKAELESYEFPIPDESWESQGGVAKAGIQAEQDKAAKKMGQAGADAEDGEIDEEEELDAELTNSWPAKEWPKHLRELTKQPVWGTLAIGRPIRMSTSCTGLSPVVAAEHFLPPGKVETISVVDTTFGSPHLGKSAIQITRKNINAQHICANLSAPCKGEGHCEIEHKVTKVPAEEDIFVGSFRAMPFLERTPSKSFTCWNDPLACPFKEQRQHIAKRKPPIALLIISDLQEIPERRRLSVLRFVFFGKGPDGNPCGLMDAGNYGIEFVEIAFKDYGVPLTSGCGLVVMVRQDRGGQAAASNAAGLIRAFAGVLPRSSVQDLLLDSSDSKLQSVFRQWKRAPKTKGQKDQKPGATKVLVKELRELGAHAGPDQPYVSDTLGKIFGDENVKKDWFPHGNDTQRLHVAAAFERAMRTGVSVESLVLNLWGSVNWKERVWGDDGLLPGSGLHYAYSVHRPLTGLEEFMMRGFDPSRLRLGGIPDLDTIVLAGSSAAHLVPVPVIGSAIFAALLAADPGPGRNFKPDQTVLKSVMKPPGEGSITVEMLREEPPPAPGTDGEIEGRAVALLNLVSHGAFGAEPVTSKPTAAAAKVIATLEKVAVEDDMGDPAEDAAALLAPPPRDAGTGDSTDDWTLRRRYLSLGKTGAKPPSLEDAVKWVRDAAEDPYFEQSKKIIPDGLKYIKDEKRDLKSLKEAGFGKVADLLLDPGLADAFAIDDAMRQWLQSTAGAMFADDLNRPNSQNSLLAQTEATMQDYVEMFVAAELVDWPRRRSFLDHIAAVSKAPSGNQAISLFTNYGGPQHVAQMLQDAPKNCDDGWPNVLNTMAFLLKWEDSAECLELTAGLQKAAGQCTKRKPGSIEERLILRAKKLLTSGQDLHATEQAMLVLERCGGSVAKRLQGTLKIIKDLKNARQAEAGDNAAALRLQGASLRVSIMDARSSGGASAVWKDIADAEDVLVDDLPKKIDDRIHEIDERKRLEDQRRREEQEQRAREENARRVRQKLAEVEAKVPEVTKYLDGDRLISVDDGDEEQLLANVNTALNGLLHQAGPTPSEFIQDAVRRVKEAACFCQERPERRAMAALWLELYKLGWCTPLLKHRGLLERFDEMRRLGTEVFRGSGLPGAIQREIVEKAQREQETAFVPSVTGSPSGWTRHRASGTNLCYFVNLYDHSLTQWRWPAQPDLPLVKPETPEPPNSLRRGEPEEDKAVYVEFNQAGTMFCILCGAQDFAHFAKQKHVAAAKAWKILTDVVRVCNNDLREQCGLTSEDVPGLAWTWQCFLRLSMIERIGSVDASSILLAQRADAIFWHQVVIPILANSPLSSPADVRRCFERILDRAHAAEPGERIIPPMPLVDYFYPSEQGEVMRKLSKDAGADLELLAKLNVDDFLGEGLEPSADGWRCRMCEFNVPVEDFQKHFHLHYNEAKTHYRNRDVGFNCAEHMRKVGWRLRHEGINVASSKFFCSLCNKTGQWYELFEEGGHLLSKTHKAKVDRVPPQPTPAEAEAWASVFAKADEDIEEKRTNPDFIDAVQATRRRLEAIVGKQAAAPKPPQPKKETASAQGALPSASKAPTPAPQKNPPAAPGPEPPKPEPGKQFCVLPDGEMSVVVDSVSEKQVESLPSGDLLREGIQRRGESFYCDVCEIAVPNLWQHLSRQSKDGKRHQSYRDAVREAARKLEQDGWEMFYQGITLQSNRFFRCGPCSKEDHWFNVFEHVKSKKHTGACAWAGLPQKPAHGSAAASSQRNVWKTAIKAYRDNLEAQAAQDAPPAAVAPSSSSSAPSAAPAKAPAKRPAPTAAPSAAPSSSTDRLDEDTEGSAKKRKTTPPPGGVRCPEYMDANTPPPTADGISDAKGKADQNQYPQPPAPIVYGNYIKKKGCTIWCQSCEAWVGWAEIKAYKLNFDPDGECAHWNADVKGALLKTYEKTASKW